jgi:hypothetical protein
MRCAPLGVLLLIVAGCSPGPGVRQTGSMDWEISEFVGKDGADLTATRGVLAKRASLLCPLQYEAADEVIGDYKGRPIMTWVVRCYR